MKCQQGSGQFVAVCSERQPPGEPAGDGGCDVETGVLQMETSESSVRRERFPWVMAALPGEPTAIRRQSAAKRFLALFLFGLVGFRSFGGGGAGIVRLLHRQRDFSRLHVDA